MSPAVSSEPNAPKMCGAQLSNCASMAAYAPASAVCSNSFAVSAGSRSATMAPRSDTDPVTGPSALR